MHGHTNIRFKEWMLLLQMKSTTQFFSSIKPVWVHNPKSFTTTLPICLRDTVVRHSDSFPVYLKPCEAMSLRCYRSADKSLAPPDWKKQLKCRHFSSDAEVIAATVAWLDGQHSELVFEWLAKFKSLVAVACFLPDWAKDLSAPGYIQC